MANNTVEETLKGLTQKPVWITNDLINSGRKKFWSNSECHLSSVPDKYIGYDIRSGLNYTPIQWYRRAYYPEILVAATQQLRQAEKQFFLQSPYGKCRSTNSQFDSIVGPDYYTPSYEYMRKLHACMLPALSQSNEESTTHGSWTRVIFAEHTFTFTNWARHDIELLIAFNSFSEEEDGMLQMLSNPNLGIITTRPAGNLTRLRIPGKIGDGDKPVSVSHTIKFSPKTFAPDAYAKDPQLGATSQSGLWRVVGRDNETWRPHHYSTSLFSETAFRSSESPWKNDSPDHEGGAAYRMKAAISMYAKFDLPQANVSMDNGVVPPAELGELGNYKLLDIGVKSKFLNEFVSREVTGIGYEFNPNYTG